MIETLGHVVQVFHWIFLWGSLYVVMTRFWGVFAVGTLLVLGNTFTDGCILTVFSNQFFRAAGLEGFSSLADWTAGFLGKTGGSAFGLATILLTLGAGIINQPTNEGD